MLVTVIMVLALGGPLAILGISLAVRLGRRIAGWKEEPKGDLARPYIPERADQKNPMDRVKPGWIGRGDDIG